MDEWSRRAAQAKTAKADAAVAAALQAQTWQDSAAPSRAAIRGDAAVAAALQAQENAARADEALAAQWQVCAALMAQSSLPAPRLLDAPHSRTPSAPRPLQGEVVSAESLLRRKLAACGLRDKGIIGDGACQFRAIADQLYGDQELHATVRNRAIAKLRSNAARYSGFAVGESFAAYLGRLEQPNTWGDNLSLQAIADAYDIDVCLVTSYLDQSFISISPSSGRPTQQVWLGFFAEYHYTSLAPAR